MTISVELLDDIWANALNELSAGPSGSVFTAQKSWNTAITYLSPKDSFHPPTEDVTLALRYLNSTQQVDNLLKSFLDSISRSFHLVRQDVVAGIEQWKTNQTIENAIVLISNVDDWAHKWRKPLIAVGAGEKEIAAFNSRFSLLLMDCLSEPFADILYELFEYLLQQAATIKDRSDSPYKLLTALQDLGIINRYQPILFRFLYDQISSRIADTCSGVWNISGLDETLQYNTETWIPWLGLVLHSDAREGLRYKDKLEYYIHQKLCDLRIQELFDIIVEYPGTQMALIDLRACLLRTGDRMALVQALRSANAKRLLHPGADTRDILGQYVATIRCLRILDAQGVLLSRVAESIRNYLRAREDTIRCIMTALIEDDGDLVDEMEKAGNEKIQEFDDDAEDFSDPNWEPDPIDAPPDFHLNRTNDIIQMLVSIYDTKDVFIKEFQILLAQSLLAIKDYNAERQIRNVELLKKRFGETSLTGCEIMLKDLADSKRANQIVHTVAEQLLMAESPTTYNSFAVILAKFASNSDEIADENGSVSDLRLLNYQNAYGTLKSDRKLRWMPQLGTVELEIELEDRVLNLEVTPLQAAIVELFQETSTWTITNLAQKLEVPDTNVVRNAFYFWANAGLLKETDDKEWVLLERAGLPGEQQNMHIVEDAPPVVRSDEERRIEELRIHWQFIKAALTNIGPLPIDRIYSMLSRFVPDFGNRTQDDLEHFMDMMRKEGVVEQGANKVWKLAT